MKALCTLSQSYYFRHYQVEQGLSNNTVSCSIQDSRGFMWFGTKDGLNRFDGYSFKTFRNQSGNPKSIGTNFIESLYEDVNGIMWVGTEKGLFRYDKQTETFDPLSQDVTGDISDIKADKKGNLWFINIPELIQFNSETKKVVNYSTRFLFEPVAISVNLNGNLFVATVDNKIREYKYEHDTFVNHTVFDPHKFGNYPSHEISTIYCIDSNKILVGTTHHGLMLFNYITGECTEVISSKKSRSEIWVRNILKVKSKIWIATESGIYIFDSITGEVLNLQKKYNNPYSISDNAVYSLCEDKEGGIWAGTYFGGVNYLANSFIEFEKYFPANEENSLSGNAVREICIDRYHNLWIGTEDAGLNKIDNTSGLFSHYQPTGKKNDIAYYNIHALLPLDDKLWIGTFLHGLDIMDIASGKIIKHYSYPDTKKGLKNNFIYSLAKNNQGQILVGTSAGLYYYNNEKDFFYLASWIPEHNFVTTIYPDRKGGIWVGTFREGVFYKTSSGKIINLRKSTEAESGLTSDRVNGIFEASDGIIWITTENGLTTYNPVTGKTNKYDNSNGLPSGVTYKALEDDNGYMWMSSSKGLIRLNKKAVVLQVYTKANGLLSDQFNYSSACKDDRGNMYFGSVKGMIKFNIINIKTDSFNTPVLLTGFQVNNNELLITPGKKPLKNSITYSNRIELNYNQSSISIDFAAISFTAPEMTMYAYKMEGLENDWTYLKSNRKIYFTNLEPGNYYLHVKAMNSSGIWSKHTQLLNIVINPPFWKSKIAYAIYIALLFAAIGIIIKMYHRRVQQRNKRVLDLLENEKAKEVYHAKIEFFTNVAHEIRTPLTLIKLPLEKIIAVPGISEEIISNLKIMEKNTNRLVDLTNQLLDFRKTENNSVTLSYVKTDVAELLEQIYTSFKPAAEQKNLQFKIELPRMPFQAYIDPEAVKKILSNLLSNAVKYCDTLIKIKILPFNSDDNFFSIRVSNDGYIIPNDMKEKIFEPFYRMKEAEKEQGTGIGLALSLSLTQLHKGTLSVDTEDFLNSFTLTLPIHQETEFELFNQDELLKAEEVGTEKLENEKNVILLVEDNVEIIDFIAKDLNSEYTVVKAYNGAEALNKIKTENVQLIISDIMMPVMDGFSLCREIKSNVELSHIPIILLTAKNTLQAKIDGLELGADAYIEKPFSQQHLLAQIKSLLNNRNKIKDHFANSPLVHIKTMAYSKSDEKFLINIDEIIQKNITCPDFNVDHLAKEMNMSRPTLYRKIKGISNLSPNDLIKVTKLKKAAMLLAEEDYKIYEVADMVGYSLASNFTRDFIKQFGINPTEYTAQKKKQK